MSRREERTRGMMRVVALHDDDGSFDREFWATIPAQRRLELVWDMVLEYLGWRGLDGDQSRLQRSVCRIERRDHLIQNKRASGRPQDLIDLEVLEERARP